VRAEHARVDRVHLLKLAHVEKEHAAAQDVLQARACRLEDRLHVFQALLGLRGDVGADQLTRRWIGRALTGDENKTLESHARRVRSDRFWKVCRVNWTM